MLETQETLTGHLTGTGSISGSVGSKSAVNAIVNNGVVVPDEIDPTVPSYVKEITEEDITRWNDKADTNHTHDEYLTAIPSEYVTEEELNNKGYLTEHQDLSEYATIEALNQKAEATHTHSQYLTEVPSEYVTESELNNKGYLTAHQDISHLATRNELNNGLYGKADTNHTHREYLTSIPSEYVTESELNNKGYATKEDLKDIDVDLTDYYTKSEIDNKGYLTQEDIGDIDVDINSISEETIKEIVNIQIVNANEVSY